MGYYKHGLESPCLSVKKNEGLNVNINLALSPNTIGKSKAYSPSSRTSETFTPCSSKFSQLGISSTPI